MGRDGNFVERSSFQEKLRQCESRRRQWDVHVQCDSALTRHSGIYPADIRKKSNLRKLNCELWRFDHLVFENFGAFR